VLADDQTRPAAMYDNISLLIQKMDKFDDALVMFKFRYYLTNDVSIDSCM